MITEQELKDRCTLDIIKRMVELAEGFEIDDDGEFIEGVICPDGCEYEFEDIAKLDLLFPLLIHRAVEGWNKKNDKGYLNFIKLDIEFLSYWFNPQESKLYIFQNYQPQSLTHYECACLHCLIEIFGEDK